MYYNKYISQRSPLCLIGVTTESKSKEMKTQLIKLKKSTTFLKIILTILIRYYQYLILRISLTTKENYPSLNNTRMIRERLFGKHTIFQMVRMMIDGITGALLTGVRSGIVVNST